MFPKDSCNENAVPLLVAALLAAADHGIPAELLLVYDAILLFTKMLYLHSSCGSSV